MTETKHPGETVTHALVSIVDLPGGPGRAALITLNNGFDHTKPNTFGPAGLISLDNALTEALSHDVGAICVTGKPFIFAVGADLTGVPMISSRDEALQIAELGHRVFRRFGECGVPTFAFVNGAALGGGVELPLHCTYRTISAGVTAFALPEVFLGLVPGWGGAYLLPHLIGIDAATTVIIENSLNSNKMLSGAQVAGMGIADQLFEPADFLERSLAWAGAVVRGDVEVPRRALDSDADWVSAVERGREVADAKFHGATPAPYRALDLLRDSRSRTRDEAFAAEDEALADLIMTDELRAGLYAFDLVQRRAKRPVGVPDKSLARPITKVGIVGAGLMATQLAMLFLRRLQVPVVITDLDQQHVDAGVAKIKDEINSLAGRKRISQDKANRLTALVTGTTDKSEFADADFVIEAVFEELSVKQAVLAELEEIVSPTCVLATNTSSLSITAMSAKLEHPERVVGFHFFNPVAVMPLLEIARAEHTDESTLATAFAVAKMLKKSAVLVADTPAFVVNRLLTRFLGEITAVVDEGTPFDVADNALEPLGLPMTPFALLQLVGPAIALHVAETMHDAFPDRFAVSENQRRIVEAGKRSLMRFDGTGFSLDPAIAALFDVGSQPSTSEQVRQRALDALAEEIGLMLAEGVVAAPQDIDLCMLLGAGWPFHLGGITPYLDRTGTSERVNGSRFLPPGYSTLPR